MEKTIEYEYRNVLKTEFQKRLSKNPQYSLRAFSRDLSIAPQMLSDVLNEKKDLSLDSAAEITNKLGLDPISTQNFLDSITLKSCKSELAKKIILQRMDERNQSLVGTKSLNAELFMAISDWYHLAILELIKCDNFKYDHRWIAAHLGITVYEVKEAISRLKNLELIDEDEEDGKLRVTEFHVSALSDVPAQALREHARQILNKGITSLEEQSQEERDISSITMAIDPKLLPEAKKMILQFRRKLCKFLESGEKKEVYVFSPILFRLTKKKLGE